MSFWTQLTENNGAQLNNLTNAIGTVADKVGAVVQDVSSLHTKVDEVNKTVATQAALNGAAGSLTAENLVSVQGVLDYFGGVKKLADGVTEALANTKDLVDFSGQLKDNLIDVAKGINDTLNVVIKTVREHTTAIQAQTAMIEDLRARIAHLPANGEHAEPAPATENDPVVQKLANELAEKKILEMVQGLGKVSLAGKT